MSTVAHPRPASGRLRPRVAEPKRQARLHLAGFAVGSAFFWLLWAAVAVTAEAWYWWLVLPVACWTLAFALRLRHPS